MTQRNKKLIKKIFQAIKELNPFRFISRLYLYFINKNEYLSPSFNVFNERPIEYRFVFDSISKFYPKMVLDVGTGLTSLPHLIANCGCNVTAIDNISDYWDYGLFNRHYHVIDEDITFVKNLKKESFDMITCISTLEHIEKFNEAVSSMFSLLKPGGHLVLTCPYTENVFIDNVYAEKESDVKNLPPFKTHSFSKQQLDSWTDGKAKIIEHECWQIYDGDFWTAGKRLSIPKKVYSTEKHQIACILIKKL